MLTRIDMVCGLNPRKPLEGPQEYRTRILDYTSVRECMEQKPREGQPDKGSAANAKENGGAEYWLGAPSWNVAMQRTAEGWPEGWQRVRSDLRMLSLPALPKRRRTRFTDDGPDLNLDRYLDGHDVCWNVRKRVAIPTVDVTVTIGATGEVSADALFWRGACAVLMTDTLERAGYRVRLTALSMSRESLHSGSGYLAALTRVRLKDYNEPLRPAHIAATVCTPALFRIGVFRSRCAAPEQVDSGMGYSCDPAPGKAGVAALHVPYRVLSRETAQEFLSKLALPR